MAPAKEATPKRTRRAPADPPSGPPQRRPKSRPASLAAILGAEDGSCTKPVAEGCLAAAARRSAPATAGAAAAQALGELPEEELAPADAAIPAAAADSLPAETCMGAGPKAGRGEVASLAVTRADGGALEFELDGRCGPSRPRALRVRLLSDQADPEAQGSGERMRRLVWRRQQVLNWQKLEGKRRKQKLNAMRATGRSLEVNWTAKKTLEFLVGARQTSFGLGCRGRSAQSVSSWRSAQSVICWGRFAHLG